MVDISETLILIPARYGSKRFPGKPLALIEGKPLIVHVEQNCRASGIMTCVVTDNDLIEEAVLSHGGRVVRTDEVVETGTERIALAFKKFFSSGSNSEESTLPNFRWVINVQGDEPLLKKESIHALLQTAQEKKFPITTLLKRHELSATNEEDWRGKHCVKSAWGSKTNLCYFFTRSPIPSQLSKGGHWYQHIGVYCYTVATLEQFSHLPSSEWEIGESLEQNRALDAGLAIGAILCPQELVGVDVPADIIRVEKILAEARSSYDND